MRHSEGMWFDFRTYCRPPGDCRRIIQRWYSSYREPLVAGLKVSRIAYSETIRHGRLCPV